METLSARSVWWGTVAEEESMAALVGTLWSPPFRATERSARRRTPQVKLQAMVAYLEEVATRRGGVGRDLGEVRGTIGTPESPLGPGASGCTNERALQALAATLCLPCEVAWIGVDPVTCTLASHGCIECESALEPCVRHPDGTKTGDCPKEDVLS